jgi:glycosyltransferase involved in cell wall biosynthesis
MESFMQATTLSFPFSETATKKVVLCIPTITKPYACTLASIAASLPSLEAAGWDHAAVYSVGCPYISHARSTMLRKALNAGADAIIFIDHDLSWQPDALLRLLEIPDEVVSGTYRFKKEPVEYMGAVLSQDDGTPMVRADGCILAHSIPAGFLKITRDGVNRFMKEWPELCYGESSAPFVDLFNHGAHGGVWFGEDFAFARRWREKCGKIWLIPDLQIDHWAGDKVFPGNFHEFLLAQPGGSNDPNREVNTALLSVA